MGEAGNRGGSLACDEEMMSQHERAMVEARRYARAGIAGIAIAFVMFVAAPQIPLTYVLAVGLFVAAGILVWVDD